MFLINYVLQQLEAIYYGTLDHFTKLSVLKARLTETEIRCSWRKYRQTCTNFYMEMFHSSNRYLYKYIYLDLSPHKNCKNLVIY